MPLYVSKRDLIDRYGDETVAMLADRDGDADEDVDPVARAIADAEAEINSYIGNRYDLPLPGVIDIDEPSANTDVPTPLRRVAVDIAIYRLAPSHDMLTREQRKRYDDAIKWLEGVAAGSISLGIADTAPAVGGGLVVTSNPRIFTRDTTDGLV